jgi:hypothetical protein
MRDADGEYDLVNFVMIINFVQFYQPLGVSMPYIRLVILKRILLQVLDDSIAVCPRFTTCQYVSQNRIVGNIIVVVFICFSP